MVSFPQLRIARPLRELEDEFKPKGGRTRRYLIILMTNQRQENTSAQFAKADWTI